MGSGILDAVWPIADEFPLLFVQLIPPSFISVTTGLRLGSISKARSSYSLWTPSIQSFGALYRFYPGTKLQSSIPTCEKSYHKARKPHTIGWSLHLDLWTLLEGWVSFWRANKVELTRNSRSDFGTSSLTYISTGKYPDRSNHAARWI